MTVHIERLSDWEDPDDAIAAHHRVDSVAFGLRENRPQRDSLAALKDPRRWYLASIDGERCGATGSFATELTVPGGHQLAAAAVADVGVVTTHRRRGVLRALMARQLADCVAAGEPVAVLHASEGGIYRRFGYGAATRARVLRADVRRLQFRDDWPNPGGALRVSSPADMEARCRRVHERVRRVTAGGLARSDAWWSVVVGDVESFLGGSPRRLAMVHEDADGAADGYVIYEMHERWTTGRPEHTLEVWELLGTTPGVELALWRALAEHDMVATVTGPIRADHALWDVLVDPRAAGITREADRLWVRILDPVECLSARRYRAPGHLVLQIRDPFMDEVSGCYRLEVDASGVAMVDRTDDRPDVTLDIADAGSLLLGDQTFVRLARAGRGFDSVDPARRADEMFATTELPWCWVSF